MIINRYSVFLLLFAVVYLAMNNRMYKSLYLSFVHILSSNTMNNKRFNHSACRTSLSATAEDPHRPLETRNPQHWSRTHF